MNYKIVSMYTKNTPYEEEVKYLEKSLISFRLDYKIYPVENLKSWEKNCQQKAIIIQKALNEFPDKNIVWIDADAVVIRNPEEFNNIKEDIAYVPGRTILSGTLFFKNNSSAKKIVQKWIEINNSNNDLDQNNLHSAVKGLIAEISKKELHIDYCKIFDSKHHERRSRKPCIIQNQASRRFKRIINNVK